MRDLTKATNFKTFPLTQKALSNPLIKHLRHDCPCGGVARGMYGERVLVKYSCWLYSFNYTYSSWV